METKKSSYQRVLQIIFTVMFYYLSTNPVHSQTWTPLAKGNASNASLIIQYDNAFNHRIGIGINGTTPTATFHLLGGTSITATPLFKVESPNNGYINYLYNDGSKSYGIYQTGTNLFNYLEGPIVSGLSFLGASSGITMISSNPFPFKFQISPTGAITTTMEVYNKKLKVIDTLECNNFRLHDNQGSGRILVGDDIGNGIWTDASTLNDNDWLVETVHGTGGNFQNLYSNPDYQNVGIGTTSPKSKLHVMDGNILISRSPTKAPGSKNGSILFGEVVTADWPLGEWGIEYYTGENGDTSKGLNFWKVATESNQGGNHYLYLRNDGNVGINTNSPCDRFQVNDGSQKFSIGSAKGESLFDGTSYIGFNASHVNENWRISSNGRNNGGEVIMGDINGNIRFATIPSEENGNEEQSFGDTDIANKIKMIITGNGNVGVGTSTPMAKFNVVNTENSTGGLFNSNNDTVSSQLGLIVTTGEDAPSFFSQQNRSPQQQDTSSFSSKDDGAGKTGILSIVSNNVNNVNQTGSIYGISSIVENSAQFNGNSIHGINSILFGPSYDKYTFGVYSVNYCQGDANKKWSGYFGWGDLQLDYGRFIIGSSIYKTFQIYTDYGENANSHTLFISPRDNNGIAIDINGVSLKDDGDFVVQKKLIANDIQVNHRLLVGTSTFPADPDGTGKVAVDGKIYAREIEVNIDSWPDNVFDSDYHLKSLKEVENYILIHKHLPDVPSESQVKSEGLNLGETNALLLKKVEELTLYVIELKKEIENIQNNSSQIK